MKHLTQENIYLLRVMCYVSRIKLQVWSCEFRNPGIYNLYEFYNERHNKRVDGDGFRESGGQNHGRLYF